MQLFTSLGFVLVIIAVALNVFFGILVFRSNPRSSTNRIYAALSLTISVWLIVNHLSFRPEYLDRSLLLIRLSLFFATPMNALFFLLAATLPRERISLGPWKRAALLGLSAFIMVLTLTPYVFQEVRILDNSPSPVPGPGIAAFGAFSIILNALAVYVLIRNYRRFTGIQKQQAKTVVIGVAAMFGAIIFTVFLPVVFLQSNTFVPFLPFYTLLFLGMTGYAIVQLQLFDLRVVATEALTLTIWIILFAKVAAARTLAEQILDSFILLTTIVFGVLLIRSVRREIEQRKKLEVLTRELEAANEKLKELDKLKSQYLSFASHQVKAPMTAVKGFAQLIYDGTYGQASDKVKEAAAKIKNSADRMIMLVNNILNVRKIEEGKMEYHFEKKSVGELLRKVVDELQSLAKTKDLELSLELKATDDSADIDEQQFRQVLQNLIENAIKYTDAGFVKVGLTAKDNSLVISVTDSGRGMDNQTISKLFSEFERGTTAVQAVTGTGLGLYIARQIVKAHKGTVWAESPGEGKGSTFFIKLPRM